MPAGFLTGDRAPGRPALATYRAGIEVAPPRRRMTNRGAGLTAASKCFLMPHMARVAVAIAYSDSVALVEVADAVDARCYALRDIRRGMIPAH